MLCQFLLYNKVNQLYVYIYSHISSLLSSLPPSLSTPLQVVTKHQIDLPVLYSSFPLAIHFTFGSVNMSLLLSHFVPASPSPNSVLKSFLYICIFISCPATRFISTIFLDSMYIRQHTVFVFLLLTSLCRQTLMSIHLTTNNSIPFLFMLSNIPLYICATSSLSIHLSMDIQVASMSWLL